MTAQASSVATSENGIVLVETSGQFQAVSQNTALTSGDALYALDGATANVALSSNCNVSVETNQVLTITSTGAVDCASMYSLEAINADHLTKLQSSDLEALFGIAGLGSAGTVAALLGLVAAVVVIADDNDDEPSSP